MNILHPTPLHSARWIGQTILALTVLMPMVAHAQIAPPPQVASPISNDLTVKTPVKLMPRMVYVGQGGGGPLVVLLAAKDETMASGEAAMNVGCGAGVAQAVGPYTYKQGVLSIVSSDTHVLGNSCTFTFQAKPGNSLDFIKSVGPSCKYLETEGVCTFETQKKAPLATLQATDPGPSFSCSDPRLNKAKRLICESPSLAFEDTVENNTYQLMLKHTKNEINRTLLESGEKEWRSALMTCRDTQCLSKAYNKQMSSFLLTSNTMDISVHNAVLWQLGL